MGIKNGCMVLSGLDYGSAKNIFLTKIEIEFFPSLSIVQYIFGSKMMRFYFKINKFYPDFVIGKDMLLFTLSFRHIKKCLDEEWKRKQTEKIKLCCEVEKSTNKKNIKIERILLRMYVYIPHPIHLTVPKVFYTPFYKLCFTKYKFSF